MILTAACATASTMLATVSDQERHILLSPLHHDLTPPRGPKRNGEKRPEMTRGGKVRQVFNTFLLRVVIRMTMLRVMMGSRWMMAQKPTAAVNVVVQ